MIELHEGNVNNPVLFETGDWRLYGHIEDEYSTMAHKCRKWSSDAFDEACDPSSIAREWRWYWGQGPCGQCHNSAPEDIMALYTLHNFDRIAEMK